MISDISSRFDKIKSTFNPPSKIDYTIGTNNTVTIDIPFPLDQIDNLTSISNPPPDFPKLAYTSTNTSIHAYTEDLNRCLSALDGVESGGNQVVREKRKQTVRAVEMEAQRMERWIWGVWESALNSQSPEWSSSLSEPTGATNNLEPPASPADSWVLIDSDKRSSPALSLLVENDDPDSVDSGNF